MKKVSLSGSPRENVGKKDAKGLRASGSVPCVVYGGDNQIHFSVLEKDLAKLAYTPDVFEVELTVGSDKFNAIVKDMQFHPVTDRILHADFLQLFADKLVTVKIPVRLNGSPIGVREQGGKMAQNFRKLAVKGLPAAMPESIELNIEPIKIGDSLRVRDVQIEGLTMLDPEGAVIVGVKMARGASVEAKEEVEEAAEEAAE